MATIEPLKRRFDGKTTADAVLVGENIKGKVFLVTGGTSGIGVSTVKALVKAGAQVIFTGRNEQAANDIITAIQRNQPDAVVKFMPLNLSSFKDVKRFAQLFLEEYQSLHVLIFNAGMFGGSFTETEDGYEAAIQVNTLSQVYLLHLLRPLLLKSAPVRVVFVSSEGHRQANIRPGQLTPALLSPDRGSYSSFKQYANSKLCQISLALYLQEHWGKDGMTFYALHPGHMIPTGIGRSWWAAGVLMAISGLFAKNVDQGASTTVYCAAASDVANQGGKYWRDCWISEPSRAGKELQFATNVWKLCQEMICAKVPDYQTYD